MGRVRYDSLVVVDNLRYDFQFIFQAKFLDLNAMKQVPRRYSIAQLDRMLSNVLEEKQRIRHNRSPKLVN